MNPARRRRHRWLSRRGRRGLTRPLPLRRVQVNGQGATARAGKTERIVLAAAKDADVLTCCEIANIDLADLLGPDWDVAQDTSKWAKAGCGIAVRRTRGQIKRWHLRLGVTAWLRGRRARQMQDRYVVVAVVKIDPGTPHRWRYKPAAGHAPPKRNWSPWWGAWMRAVKALPVHDLGSDFNRRRRMVRKILPRRLVLMLGIDGFAIRRWIPAGDLDEFDVGGDHPAVRCTLWPHF